MRFRHLCILTFSLVALALLTGQSSRMSDPGAPPQTYTIDPVHSTALFRVHHLGAGRFYGRFNDVRGTITYAEGSDADLTFDVSIAIDSIDTGSDRLNGHLKSPDFFNAREFPKMTFKSISATKVKGNTYAVTGELTIHGVSKTVNFEAEWTGTANMGKGTRCGFEAIFTVKRSDYGVKYGLEGGVISDEVKLIVSLEGIKR